MKVITISFSPYLIFDYCTFTDRSNCLWIMRQFRVVVEGIPFKYYAVIFYIYYNKRPHPTCFMLSWLKWMEWWLGAPCDTENVMKISVYVLLQLTYTIIIAKNVSMFQNNNGKIYYIDYEFSEGHMIINWFSYL